MKYCCLRWVNTFVECLLTCFLTFTVGKKIKHKLIYLSLLSFALFFSHFSVSHVIYAWTYAYGIFFFLWTHPSPPPQPHEESQPYVTCYRDADRDCLFLRWRNNHSNKTSKMDWELIYAQGKMYSNCSGMEERKNIP